MFDDDDDDDDDDSFYYSCMTYDFLVQGHVHYTLVTFHILDDVWEELATIDENHHPAGMGVLSAPSGPNIKKAAPTAGKLPKGGEIHDSGRFYPNSFVHLEVS